MMIKVEAIVREEVFEDVKEALNAIDVNGITVSQVMGCGAQRGYKKRVRGTEVDVMMQPKIKFEIVVSSEEWEKATQLFVVPKSIPITLPTVFSSLSMCIHTSLNYKSKSGKPLRQGFRQIFHLLFILFIIPSELPHLRDTSGSEAPRSF